MKIFITMILLLISVTTVCVLDGIYTNKIFNTLTTESENIYYSLLETDIENEEIQNKITDLNDFWTKKMDTLCISISRKDLQPISDYLQYLYSSITNKNQEDAITYSKLLYYNAVGLKETTGITLMNLL